jgi:cysteinyl-tRNA synthetase
VKLFNTLSRSVEEFAPSDPAGKGVGMYCCGPTVYDFAHIGNWRTFVFGDLVRRWLEFKGCAVTHVMNITDVEDKIIRRVRETGKPLAEYTGQFERAFFDDFKSLNCLPPHHTPRATEHMAQVIGLIGRLLERGMAYKAADGSVYFSIERYRGCGCVYGQLVKLNFEEMRAGERVKNDEYAKEAVADFALWKARTPEDGAVFWPSPWGEGRPGWHIECSAMSMEFLGPSFDLHLGGEDLVFPHHEDEIAQSEGAGVQPGGRRFVKHWMHGAHLLVEGRKMSKSLGNFFTLRDLTGKGFKAREIRDLLLSAHYRETFNFTLEGLEGSRSALARLDECILKLRELAGPAIGPSAAPDASTLSRFTAALDDDLNISGARAALFDWLKEMNRAIAAGQLARDRAAVGLATFADMDRVLGLQLLEAAGSAPDEGADAACQKLLGERQAARKAKDFKRADAIRDELKSKGWAIEDTAKGPRLRKL